MMKKSTTRLISCVIAAILVIALLASMLATGITFAGAAEDVDELQDKLSSLEDEKAAVKEKIAELTKQANDVEATRAALQSEIDLTKEEFANVILAYEPVWAIGTGKTATAEQAEEMHAFIRQTIAEKFGAEAAENVSILYGGSCKPTNAKELFSKPDVDGGLIGGAALKAADFKGIIDAWK